MSEDEQNEFIGNGGTGVISFETPNDDPPYARPVSYGYDRATGSFYFRLAVGPEDTGKAAIVDEESVVSFVTYDLTGGGWRSVIATGPLVEITKSALDPAVTEAMERLTIPFVDIYDSHPLTSELRFFRLDPDVVTGKQETGTAN